MKRTKAVHWLLFMFICILIISPAQATTIRASDLTSASCMLIDAHTGEVLFEKDADTHRSMASTTKIMTLLLAIELTDPNEIVTIPSCVEDIALDSSRVPVYYGEKMPMRDLWYGLIYRSGNDAANAIAYLASGSVDAFIKKMNEKAAQLGMDGTKFANAHGYTQTGHYTTARDLAKLARYALDIDVFREVTLSRTYTMAATTLRPEMQIIHDYAILDPASGYYYPYARGIKTGYTIRAGQCFVSAAIKDGTELVLVMLNCGGLKETKWGEAKTLFKYGFEELESRRK